MPSFVEIGSPILEKNLFFFFDIYVRGGRLGNGTCIMFIHIGSLFLEMLHIKFGFDWPSGFREDL